MADKRYYYVGVITHKHDTKVSVYGVEFTLPIKLEWTDGMIGVLPVFTNKKKALKYANKKYTVFEIVGKSINTKLIESTITKDK